MRLMFFLASAAVALLAQDPPTPSETPATPPAAVPATPPAARPGAAEPQPYDKVITKEAKTKRGIVSVHQVKERYFFEIPKSQFGLEFLFNVRLAKTVAGVGNGGDQMASLVVKWELANEKVHLRQVNHSVAADPNSPIALAVAAANNSSILMTFPVAAFASDGAPVIDVGRLYTSDMPEFEIRRRLNATAADASRSYMESITPYPDNVEAEASLTYTRIQPAPGPTQIIVAGGMRPGSATVVVHYSLVKLPEHPMMPRLDDGRVGFFGTSRFDYSKEEQRAPRVNYISRWRLEKKNPELAVSEPVKPIIYYIDPATPMKWREWIKRGVEDWQPAFEAAGFRNAIQGKLAPSLEEVPDFSPDNVRYSVIRWMPSTIENAFGPHISDPRTGEILNANIQMYHNILNLQRDWYFLQVGPLDARAQKLPLPDDLMGRLLEFVVAHEVGHTLGFPHNMKASSMYPQKNVRDKNWVHTMGHTPSIMDYSRFNYVAQPEDGIALEDLIPRVGPYDVFATKWGYTPIPTAKTPDDEKSKLDEWAREQDKTPWLRFSTSGANGSDFGELTEAVGDADAIQSSAQGLKNLQRVQKMLLSATSTKNGEPYEDLAELYGRMLGQWSLEMNHVAAIIGGFSTQTKYVGQDGRLFVPVPKARQQMALEFLRDNALATPNWAIDPEILRRIEPTGVLNRIRNAQNGILANVMSTIRFNRLVEQEAVDGASAFTPADFLVGVRRAVWQELDLTNVKIDAYRRNLQRAYLDQVNGKVNGNGLGDERSFYRAELRTLRSRVMGALAHAPGRETQAHLEGVRDQIERILDPKFNAAGGGAAGPLLLFGISDADLCWPDYVISAN